MRWMLFHSVSVKACHIFKLVVTTRVNTVGPSAGLMRWQLKSMVASIAVCPVQSVQVILALPSLVEVFFTMRWFPSVNLPPWGKHLLINKGSCSLAKTVHLGKKSLSTVLPNLIPFVVVVSQVSILMTNQRVVRSAFGAVAIVTANR